MVGPEGPFDVGDDVHDVRVALDGHEVGHLDGGVVADPPDVVAGEVDQHDVLGPLLGVGEELLGHGLVLQGIVAAGTGPGDGADGDLPPLGADVDLWGGADQGEVVQLEAEHVGRGIDQPERAVEIGGIALEGDLEALGGDDLEDIARADELLHPLGHAQIFLLGHVDLRLELDRIEAVGEELVVDGALQLLLEAVDLGDGLVVGPVDVALDVGVGDQLHPAVDVVEDHQRIGDDEVGIGNVEVVELGAGDGLLEVGDRLVGEVADGAAVEEGEVPRGDRPVGGHQPLQLDEGIGLAGELALAAVLLDDDFLPPHGEDPARVRAEKGIAGEFLPALDRLEEERLGARLLGGVELEVGGDGRIEIGDDLPVDRNQVPLTRQLAKGIAGREQHIGGDEY